ncbi:MAG: lysophospholipid acyltransferase family protein [Verrucomicrobia bacterium]|nr:lysophospholipid acyltransferase family protein [Verrucomicrobiota bacterium]
MPQKELMPATIQNPPGKGNQPGTGTIAHPPKWHQRLAGTVVFSALKLVGMTIRRLALCLHIYDRFLRGRPQGGSSLAAMVSASKDGALLSVILELFKVQPARGSSSRRGPQALRELTSWSRKGFDLAITPDGPRGPCYNLQEGLVYLAQLTNKPVYLVSYHLQWKICLKSWDRFQIPLPFSRCDVIIEKPVHVPRDLDAAGREAIRLQLEQTLRSITRD